MAEVAGLSLRRFDNRSRLHHGRVVRFIRPGVDRIMEQIGLTPAGIPKKGYGRVSYFMASRVAKEDDSMTETPVHWHNKNYRRVNYFVASGIEKGEGHLGGGTVTNILEIGFNPKCVFKEHRIKRQFIRPVSDQECCHAACILNRKAYSKNSAEYLKLKKHHMEAAAEIEAKDLQKTMEKENRNAEKKRDYEELKNYNPWGRPAVGAPKATRSGQGWHLGDDEKKYDLFGRPKEEKEGKNSTDFHMKAKAWVEPSEFEKSKLLKEKERKEYISQYLERQRITENDRKKQEKKDNSLPTDIIWGRTDVQRDISGKLIRRKRQLYQLDHGSIQKNYKTYVSIADKMVRMPAHQPVRGRTNDPTKNCLWTNTVVGPETGTLLSKKEAPVRPVTPVKRRGSARSQKSPTKQLQKEKKSEKDEASLTTPAVLAATQSNESKPGGLRASEVALHNRLIISHGNDGAAWSREEDSASGGGQLLGKDRGGGGGVSGGSSAMILRKNRSSSIKDGVDVPSKTFGRDLEISNKILDKDGGDIVVGNAILAIDDGGISRRTFGRDEGDSKDVTATVSKNIVGKGAVGKSKSLDDIVGKGSLNIGKISSDNSGLRSGEVVIQSSSSKGKETIHVTALL